MKKTITRLMTMLLAVTMMMGMFVTNASAATTAAENADQKASVKANPQHIYVPQNELFECMAVNAELTARYWDKYHREIKAWSNYAPVTMYLNRLSKYMPHVTDAQRTTVTKFPYSYDGWYPVIGVTDPSVLSFLDTFMKNNPQKLSCEIDRYVPGNYAKQGMLTNTIEVQLVGTQNVTDRVAGLFADGRFVSMEYGRAEVDNDAWFRDSGAFAHAWLSGSMQNDKLVRNVYLHRDVGFYGENTFRGSALETVVFPYYWYSDHNVYTEDRNNVNGQLDVYRMNSTMPLGVMNDLLFGKNANIIEANAFADCANLKSVIMPCEPAHLYIADGVFANCPNLTVYGAAGGKLESYCKAHNVKFVAIPEATIEAPLDASIAPQMWAFDHVGKLGWNDNCVVDQYATISGRVVSADGSSNYPNAMGITTEDKADFAKARGISLLKDAVLVHDTTVNAVRHDLNRYRSDAVNAKEFMDNYGSGVLCNLY